MMGDQSNCSSLLIQKEVMMELAWRNLFMVALMAVMLMGAKGCPLDENPPKGSTKSEFTTALEELQAAVEAVLAAFTPESKPSNTYGIELYTDFLNAMIKAYETIDADDATYDVMLDRVDQIELMIAYSEYWDANIRVSTVEMAEDAKRYAASPLVNSKELADLYDDYQAARREAYLLIADSQPKLRSLSIYDAFRLIRIILSLW